MEETQEYLQRGDEFFDATKYMEAIQFYEKFVKFFNEHNEIDENDKNIKISEAYFRIGRSFLRLGKLNRSIESFSQALTCNPHHVFAYIMTGFALQDIQRKQEAEQMFETALNLIEDNQITNQNERQSLLHKGLCYDGLAKYDIAIMWYDKLLSLEPDHDFALKAKGDVLWFLDKKTEALNAYDQAICVNKKCVTAYLNKAAILAEMSRLEEALVCYDKLLEINSTSSIAINRKRKLFYKANKNSIKLHELNGDIMHAIFFYEKALTMDSTKKETLNLINKALQMDPAYEDALRYKAAILCDSKKYDECIEVCDLILSKIDPYCEESNVYGMKAEALSSLSKHREAIRWISKTLKYAVANKKTSYQKLKVKYEERARSSLFGI